MVGFPGGRRVAVLAQHFFVMFWVGMRMRYFWDFIFDDRFDIDIVNLRSAPRVTMAHYANAELYHSLAVATTNYNSRERGRNVPPAECGRWASPHDANAPFPYSSCTL
jgi:hypothetical protein